jgi:molybdopterin-guanine dinucleotide biosynthesis protein A
MQAAGYVLVGGHSSRMGRNKAFLPGQFRYVLDDVAQSVRAATGNVTLIGNPSLYQEIGYPCIPDLRPGLGPLSGLEAALVNSHNDLNLILACDMPAIDPAHLRSLVEQARVSKASCVVTHDVTGQVHPLCAVYKKDCLPVIQCRLDEKRLSLTGLLDEVGTEYVRLESVVQNINTPEEWTRWNSKQSKHAREGWPILT